MLDIDKTADVIEELEVDVQLQLMDDLKKQKLQLTSSKLSQIWKKTTKFPYIARKGLVGIILGTVCGFLVAIVATIWQGVPEIGLVVGISMALSLVIAAVMGSLTPWC
jgi:Mg/Co/Ni transporter MgtE